MIYFCIQCNIGRVAKLASTAIYRGCGTGNVLTSCHYQGIIKEKRLLYVHFSLFELVFYKFSFSSSNSSLFVYFIVAFYIFFILFQYIYISIIFHKNNYNISGQESISSMI